MAKSGVKAVDTYQAVIEELLIPKDILSELSSRNVNISEGVAEKINKSQIPNMEACRELLNELKKLQPGKWFTPFIASLKAANYTALVLLLKDSEYSLPYEDHKRYTELIKKHASRIESQVDIDSGILNECIAEKLINDRNKEEIECMKKNSGQMDAIRLLLTFIHRQHTDWFKKFMVVLVKYEHKGLAEKIATKQFIASLNSRTATDERPPSCKETANAVDGTPRKSEDDVGVRQVGRPKKQTTSLNIQSAAAPSTKQRRPSTTPSAPPAGATAGATAAAAAAPSEASVVSSGKDTSKRLQYSLVKRNGRIKKCKGCEKTFSESDEAVLKESHGTRHFYYHPHKSCVSKTNPTFSSCHVTPEPGLVLSQESSRLMSGRGFLKK